jgi:hypothetical protein
MRSVLLSQRSLVRPADLYQAVLQPCAPAPVDSTPAHVDAWVSRDSLVTPTLGGQRHDESVSLGRGQNRGSAWG